MMRDSALWTPHLRNGRVWVLLALAFLVRVCLALLVPVEPLAGDAIQYDGIARSLLRGDGFAFMGDPTALRPPVYPAFLATVYAAFGDARLWVRIVQAVLDAGTVFLVLRIGVRHFSLPVAWVAAGLVAFHPGLAFMTTEVLTETLFTLLLTLAILLYVRAQREGAFGLVAASGLVMGIAALCRPNALLVPFALLPAALVVPDRKRRLGLAAVCAVVTVLAVSPWTVRNRIEFGETIPISTSSFAPALWYGSYPDWDLEWRGWDEPPLDSLLGELDEREDVLEVNRILLEDAKKNIAENPGTFAWFALRKTWELWRPPPGTKEQVFGSTLLMWGLRGYHVAFVLLSTLGVIWGFRCQRDVWMIALVVCWTSLAALTVAVPRYLLPLVPLLALYAAEGGRGTLSAARRAFDRQPSSH